MSFTWKGTKLYSYEAGAKTIIDVGRSMGITPKGITMAIACVRVEADFWLPGNLADPCYRDNKSAYRHDSESNDGLSSGWYQQQMSKPGVDRPWGWGGLYGDPEGTRKRMDPVESTKLFFNALKAQRVGNQDYNTNAKSPGIWVADVQKCAPEYRKRYDEEWAWASALYAKVANGNYTPGTDAPVAPTPLRPDFVELDFMTGGGRSNRSQKPRNFFIHTEEGNSTAEQLARYCNGSNGVSYHYTVRARKVADVVDTDYASWSVLDANVFSINGCFAGSKASWTREEWLKIEPDIEIMAYLAVQDCRKYGMSFEVLVPRWALSGSDTYEGGPRGGISDHNYVTRELGIGSHHDVGPNFPWDRFVFYVRKFIDGVAGDDMAAVPQEEWNAVRDALIGKGPSGSIFATPGEGSKWTVPQLVRNMDRNDHHALIEKLAVVYGDDDAIMRVWRVADGGGVDQSEWAVDFAKKILARIDKDTLTDWLKRNGQN